MYEELRKLVDPNNEACCDSALGRLCKEWCYEQGFVTQTDNYTSNGTWRAILKKPPVGNIHSRYSSSSYEGYIELEAIIKATEWVAKEKDLL